MNNHDDKKRPSSRTAVVKRSRAAVVKPTVSKSAIYENLRRSSTRSTPTSGSFSFPNDSIYETNELLERVSRAEEFIDYLKTKYENEQIREKTRLSLQLKKTHDFGIMTTEKSISEDRDRYFAAQETKYTNCTPEEQQEIYQTLAANGSTVTLSQLIEWGDFYRDKKRVMCGRLNLKLLHHLQKPLKELQSMVGLEKFKANVVEQILMCLQDLHRNPNKLNDEMFHTVIYGPPGVGKTRLAKILGHIYIAMGLIYKKPVDLNVFKIDDYFVTASRSDLIGMFCGHTAVQTQKIIDNCRKSGKVLFIDETYSLGDKEGRDNFSKECIDTINSNLTDGAGEFICIIAGYPEDIKKCFFAHNKGLERRFNFRYTVEKYNFEELLKIFLLKLEEDGWGLLNDQVITAKYFEDNQDYFSNCGGDVVAFLTKCRIVYSNRVFLSLDIPDRKLTVDDIKRATELFKHEREDSAKSLKEKREKDTHDKDLINRMYI